MAEQNQGSRPGRPTVQATQYDNMFKDLNEDFSFLDYLGSQQQQPLGQINQTPEFSGLISPEELRKFDKQDVPFTPFNDTRQLMAARQSRASKAFNSIARGAVGFAAAIVEPATFLLDFEEHYKALTGAERDYSNWAANLIHAGEDALREAAPIYTSVDKPDPLISGEWWAQNSDQLIRSIGYLFPARWLYSGLGKAAQMVTLGNVANKSAKAVQATKVGTELFSAVGSATLMNYSEHAVSAYRAFEENYPKYLQAYKAQGMSDQDAAAAARTQASEDAATIVKKGKANILWASISQWNLFRGLNYSRARGLIKGSTPRGLSAKQIGGRMALEMSTEGLEEVWTGYLEREARYKSDRALGLRVPDNRAGWEKYIEHATSWEGITEGLSGMLGAGPTTALQSSQQSKAQIDAHQQVLDTKAELGAKGEKVQEMSDLDRGSTLFQHALMNLQKGTYANFMDILKGYQNISQEEAEKLNFDEGYKERAQEYIEDAEMLENLFNKYNSNPVKYKGMATQVMMQKKYAERVYSRQLKKYQDQLNALNAERDNLKAQREAGKIKIDQALWEIKDGELALKGMQDSLTNAKAVLDLYSSKENQLKDEDNIPGTTLTKKDFIDSIAKLESAIPLVKKQLEIKRRLYKGDNEMSDSTLNSKLADAKTSATLDEEFKNLSAELEQVKQGLNSISDNIEELERDPAKLNAEGKKLFDHVTELDRARREQKEKDKVQDEEGFLKRVKKKAKNVINDGIQSGKIAKEKIKRTVSKDSLSKQDQNLVDRIKKSTAESIDAEMQSGTILGQTRLQEDGTWTSGNPAIMDAYNLRQKQLAKLAEKESPTPNQVEGEESAVAEKESVSSNQLSMFGNVAEVSSVLSSLEEKANNFEEVEDRPGVSYYVGKKGTPYAGMKFERQTNATSRVLGRELGVQPNAGQFIGTRVDMVAREVFDGTWGRKTYAAMQATQAEIEFGSKLKEFKEYFEGKGYTFHSKGVFLTAMYNEDYRAKIQRETGQEYMGIAGTLDLVAIDAEGQAHIIDFKTYGLNSPMALEYLSDNIFKGGKYDARINGWTNQQSVYKLLAEANGISNASIHILPIGTSYESSAKQNEENTAENTFLDAADLLGELQNFSTRDNILGKDLGKYIIQLNPANNDAARLIKQQIQVFDDHISAFPAELGDVNNGDMDRRNGMSDINKNNSRQSKASELYFKEGLDGRGRQIKSASSIKFSSIGVREIEIDIKGKKSNILVSATTQKWQKGTTAEDSNPLVESADVLQAGSKVVLRLVGPNKQVITKEEIEALEGEQKSEFVKELEVMVSQEIDGNLTDLALMHNQAWVKAQMNNDYSHTDNSDNNVQKQIEQANKIREFLAAQSNLTYNTTVEYKGTGKVFQLLQTEEDGTVFIDNQYRTIPRNETPLKEALPNWKNLELAIVSNGEFQTRRKVAPTNIMQMSEDANYGNGRVTVLLPTPNGKLFPSVLWVKRLDADQTETIIGAATSFRMQDPVAQQQTFDAIADATGVVSWGRGVENSLTNFLSRYMYINSGEYVLDPDASIVSSKIHVHAFSKINVLYMIDSSANTILYTNEPDMFYQGENKATRMENMRMGNPALIASRFKDQGIREIRDIQQFPDTVASMLSQKLHNLDLASLNSNEEFVDIKLNADGSMKSVGEFKNYKDFKANYLQTDINGQNFITKPDGSVEYTYMTTPLVVINTDFTAAPAEDVQGQELSKTEIEDREALDNILFDDDDFAFPAPVESEEKFEERTKQLIKEEFEQNRFDITEISLALQNDLAAVMFSQINRKIIDGQKTKFNVNLEIDDNIVTDDKSLKGYLQDRKEHIEKVRDKYKERVDAGDLNLATRLKALNYVLDNWFAKKKGKVSMEGIIRKKLNELGVVELGNTFTGTVADWVKQNYDDSAIFKIDRKDTASSNFKLYLSTFTDPSSRTWIGAKRPIEYANIYDALKSTLVNKIPSLDNYIDILKNKSANRIFKEIADDIIKQPLQLQKEFITAMSGTKAEFKTLLIDRSGTSHTLKVLNQDQFGTTTNILNNWLNNLKTSKLVTTDEQDELIIDLEQVQKLEKKYDNILLAAAQSNTGLSAYTINDKGVAVPTKFATELVEVLADIGIQVPVEAFMYLNQNPESIPMYLGARNNWKNTVELYKEDRSGYNFGLMGYIFSAFNNEVQMSEDEVEQLGGRFFINNPIQGNSYEKSIRGLAKLTIDFNGVVYGQSTRNTKGQLIYPMQLTNGMQIELNNLMDRTEKGRAYIAALKNEVDMTTGSIWLESFEEIVNGKKTSFEDTLKVFFFDATKNLISWGQAPKERSEQGEFLQVLTSIGLFQNQGAEFAYFFPYTLADKTTTPLIQAPKYLSDRKERINAHVSIDNGQVYDISKTVINDFYGYSLGEWNRIYNWQNENKQKAEGNNLGAYEAGANFFYRFPYLNAEMFPEGWNGSQLRDIKTDAVLRERVKAVIKENLINEINSKIDKLDELNILSKEDGTSLFDDKYLFGSDPLTPTLRNPDMEATDQDFNAIAVADYYINNKVFLNEFMILFGGDPAQAFKRGNTLAETLRLTLKNYEKRLAMLLSPRSNTEYEESTVRTVTLVDSLTDSGAERTDAQEYGTLEEGIKMKHPHGRVSDDVKKIILDKIQEVKNDENNPTNFFRLKDILNPAQLEEVRNLLVPDKPVWTANDQRFGANLKFFRKSSTYWLLPENTKGTDRDNLRVVMENNGVGRVGHESSDKLGAINPISAYDTETGQLKSLEELEAEFAKPGVIRELSRNGLGWQQEKPAEKDKNSRSSQMHLAFAGISNLELQDSKYGKTVKELSKFRGQVVSSIFQIQADILYEELGVEIDKDGVTIQSINMEAFSKLLEKEAETRNWSIKDQSEIKVEKIDGLVQFVSPLLFNTSRDKIAAIVLSIIRKRVATFKMPGLSLVQATGSGFRNQGGMTDSEFTAADLKDTMIIVPGYDASKGLQGPRIENGVFKPAQIAIRPHIKNKDGKFIDLTSNKYTVRNRETGRRELNLKLVPKELLEMIGYRTPGQGLPSNLAIEVVAFLSANSPAVAVLPDVVVEQMGADFDIDVLFTYFNMYKQIKTPSGVAFSSKYKIVNRKAIPVMDDGSLMTDKGLENWEKNSKNKLEAAKFLYYDVLKNFFFDSGVFKATENLDNDFIKNAIDVSSEVMQLGKTLPDPTDMFQQVEGHISQLAGKALIGIATNTATLNLVLEGRNILPQMPTYFEEETKWRYANTPFTLFADSQERTMELDSLSETGKYSVTTERGKKESRTSNKLQIDIQNIVIDNAVKQLADSMNYTEATASEISFLTLYRATKGVQTGLDHSQIVWFARQEVLRDYRKEFFAVQNELEAEFRSTDAVREEAYERVRTKYERLAQREQPIEDLQEEWSQYSFSPQNLLDMLDVTKEKNVEYYNKQLAILAGFREISMFADPLNKIRQAVSNPRTLGIGTDQFAADEALRNMAALFNAPDNINQFANLKNLRDTEYHALYLALNKAWNLFSSELPVNSPVYMSFMDLYKAQTNSKDISQAQRKQLLDSLLNWGYATAFSEVFGDLQASREELIVDPENNVAKQLFDAQGTKWGKNNLFIQKLYSIVSSGKNVPNSIHYVASKKEDLEDRVYSDFIELYLSGDPEQRKFFETAIKYSYAMGGNQRARNFVKFISTGYLKSIGFYDRLRVLQDEILNNPTTSRLNLSKLFVEYIQHYPKKAMKLNDVMYRDILVPDSEQMVKDNKTKSVATFKLMPIKNALQKNKDTRALMIKSQDLLNFPKVLNKAGRLYERIGLDKEGNTEYVRIGTRGNSKYQVFEYSGTSNTKSVFAANLSPGESLRVYTTSGMVTNGQTIMDGSKDTNVPEVSTTPYGFLEDETGYSFIHGQGNPAVVKLLEEVERTTQDPFFKEIANVFKSEIPKHNFTGVKAVKGTLEVENIEGSNKKAAASYNSKTGIITVDLMYLDNRKRFETGIMHEIIHGLTIDGLKNNTRFSNEINRLLKVARKNINVELIADADTKKLFKHYLKNEKEFVAGMFTDTKFRNTGASIKAGKKTIWGRFQDAVRRFISFLTGVQAVEDSVMEQTFNAVMTFTLPDESFLEVEETVKEAEKRGANQVKISIDTVLNEYRGEKGAIRAEYEKLLERGVSKDVAQNALNAAQQELDLLNSEDNFAFPAPEQGVMGFPKSEALTSLDNTIRNLQKRVTGENITQQEGQQLKGQIETYKEQRKKLSEAQSAEQFRTVINDQIAWANRILSEDSPSHIQLKTALEVYDTWDYEHTSQYLTTDQLVEGNVINDLLFEVSTGARKNKGLLLNKINHMLTDMINNDMDPIQITAQQLKEMKETSWGRSRLLDLSHFDNPLVQKIDAVLKNAAANYEGVLSSMAEEIDNAWEKVQDHPKLKDNPAYFIQKDDEGNLTKYFVDPLSDKWYKEKSEFNKAHRKKMAKVRNNPLFSDAQKRERINNIRKPFFEAINKKEITIDIRFFLDETLKPTGEPIGKPYSSARYKSKEDYITFLISELGSETAVRELIDDAKARYKRYLKEEFAQRSVIIDSLRYTENMTQEDIEAKIALWVAENSPINYLMAKYEGAGAEIDMKGNKYVVSAPRKRDQNGKDLGYYSKQYEDIMADAKLAEFYKFYVDKMAEFMELLPTEVIQSSPRNLYPTIKKTFIEEVTKDGTMGMFGAMGETMKKFWNGEIDQINQLVGFQGNVIEEIPGQGSETKAPREFSGRLKKTVPYPIGIKGRGKVQAEDMSLNVGNVMKMFGAGALNFSYKTQIEDLVKLMQRLLEEANELQVDAFGDPIRYEGKKTNLTYNDGLSNTREAVEYAIDGLLYGVTRSPIGQGKIKEITVNPFNRGFWKGFKDLKGIRANEIQKELKQLKEDRDNGLKTEAEFKKESEQLNAEFKKLNVTGTSGDQAIESFILLTQLRGIGWSLTSAVNNIGFGTLSNLVHAAGQEDYTEGGLLKSYHLLLTSIRAKDTKYANLMKKYGIMFESIDTLYGTNKKTQWKMLNILNPWHFMERTEYLNQGAGFIAKMLNTKVTDLKGKERTLLEAYDNKGEWNTAEFGEEGEWKSNGLAPQEENSFTRFRQATIAMNKMNHGNYDPKSLLLAKKEVYGRLFTIFRTWMFEGFNLRWAKGYQNKQLGRWVEGRYRSFYNVGGKGSLKFMGKSAMNFFTGGMAYSQDNLKGDMSDINYANMRKNVAELKYAIIIKAAMMLLGALAGDDDDKGKGVNMFMRNTLHRLWQDVWFYINPFTFWEIMRNPTPVIKTGQDFASAIKGTYKTLTDEDYRGDSPTYKWSKVIPGFKNYSTWKYLSEEEAWKQ